MRDPDRIPLICSALDRRWAACGEEHFGAFFMGRLIASGVDWHPLVDVMDVRLVEVLASFAGRVERGPDLSAYTAAAAATDAWASPGRDVVLGALATTWRADIDSRLGQLFHNAFRLVNPDLSRHHLFVLEDGGILSLLGDLTADEQAYVAGEPAARLRGWREWEQSFRDGMARGKDLGEDREP